MRLVLLLVALVGGFVLVGMLIAPYQPTLRDWYIQHACQYLDQLSADICAAARREAGGKAALSSGTATSGVRPCRWTGLCCGFDQGLGVLILEVDGTAVPES